MYQPYPKDLATWKRQREELKVISFLATRNPQYESAKNQLLTGYDLPSLNSTFSRLSRMSMENDVSETRDGDVALSATTPSTTRTFKGRKDTFAAAKGVVRLETRKRLDTVTVVKCN